MFELSDYKLNGYNTGVIQKKETGMLSVNQKFVPKKLFLTRGVGIFNDPLISFELALRDAGIEKFNLVTVSSIYPPGCEIVDKMEGLKELYPGQVVFCVMARMTSNMQGEKVFASVGGAVPEDSSLNGYLTEYHGYLNGEDVGRRSEKSAAYMLRTAFNIEPARTFNATIIAEVKEYTTVLSAAVFGL